MAPAYSTTLKADMLAVFPEPPPKIIGIPNLREMIRIMYHMMACSQSHASQASPLGLLFVCLPQPLWAAYSQDPYPADPMDPGFVPAVNPNFSPVEADNYKSQWAYVKTVYEDFRTMNSALIDRFLSLMDPTYTTDFTYARVTHPTLQFRDCFTYFIGRYGATNETERSENRERMKAPWTLQEGWERLQKQIDDGHIYSLFANHPIQDTFPKTRNLPQEVSSKPHVPLFVLAYVC